MVPPTKIIELCMPNKSGLWSQLFVLLFPIIDRRNNTWFVMRLILVKYDILLYNILDQRTSLNQFQY